MAEARFTLAGVGPDNGAAAMDVRWTLTRIETTYQWYQSFGNWMWGTPSPGASVWPRVTCP